MSSQKPHKLLTWHHKKPPEGRILKCFKRPSYARKKPDLLFILQFFQRNFSAENFQVIQKKAVH